jgi:hypothetical protein
VATRGEGWVPPIEGKHVSSLELWQDYDRRAVHDIFEPDTTFTPQTGKWGLPGIVKLGPDGDFVFFVTFGSSQGDHDFEESIGEDGVLTWQSQPQQHLESPVIKQLVSHDDLTNTIHLFLRTKKNVPYTYLGRLGYLEHDPARERPVYFTWQLMDWPPAAGLMESMAIVLAAPADPITPATQEVDTLKQTPPPAVATGTGKGGTGGGKKAVLAGQDAKNRKLGLDGELLVITHERARLIQAGRKDLADRIVHVAVVEGDSAGYDVRSFNVDGTERHIEVKTTGGPATNAFFISPNEVTYSVNHPDTYVLMRLYGYVAATNSANYYEQVGSIEDSFGLTPSEYRAKLLPSS